MALINMILWLFGFLFYNFQRFVTKALTVYNTSRIKGKHGKISGKCVIYNQKNIFLGENTYINGGSYLHAGPKSKIIIGNNCLISYNVHIRTVDHLYEKVDIPIIFQGNEEKSVTIGDNVWIGYAAQILPGVNIGNNVIIGAGAIVTKDVPDSCVAAGVPARIIKERK